MSGPVLDKIQKYIIRNFRENFDLKITITTDLKIVIFLDVPFDLSTGRSQPYKKPNDTHTYININSKHPHNIMNEMLHSISRRINNTSSDKTILSYATLFHNDLLSASGYKKNLVCQKDDKITQQQNFVRRETLKRT